jgi:hypothetical protein
MNHLKMSDRRLTDLSVSEFLRAVGSAAQVDLVSRDPKPAARRDQRRLEQLKQGQTRVRSVDMVDINSSC